MQTSGTVGDTLSKKERNDIIMNIKTEEMFLFYIFYINRVTDNSVQLVKWCVTVI